MTGSENDSFDPRAWVKGDSPPTPPVAPEPPAPRVGRKRPVLLASLASVGLLAAATLAAWLNRDPHPHAAAAAAPVAQATPRTPGATMSQRIVNLANPRSLREALIANGVPPAETASAMRAALSALGGRSEEIRAAMTLEQKGSEVHLLKLDVSFIDSAGAVVTPGADGQFVAHAVAASLGTRIVDVRGEMNDTDFYSSAVAAGITDSLISTIAQAFVYDFNFQTEINPGDIFEAAFEQTVNKNGDPVGPPRLLYASVTTGTKSKAVYRFQPPGGEEGWFDGNGRSVKRSFMRTPVDGARITSHFGMRFHPVLHYTRLHGGIDLAAPVGTPIYASAMGNVVSASFSECGGNMVILHHDNGWETRYLHMEHFQSGIGAGVRVQQGQELGVIGVTGSCTTGPHLHYEVWINGEKADPETIPTEQGEILKDAVLKAFLTERDRIDVARVRSSG